MPFLLLAPAVAAPAAAQTTYYVDDCGSDASSGLSPDCQFPANPEGPKQTIQGALSVAQANDVIQVLPGTYPGGVAIDKDGVSLLGCGCDETVAQCQRPTITPGGIVVTGADFVTVRGLSIEPVGGDAVVLHDSLDSHVLCNTIDQAGQAITLSNCDRCQAAGNDIQGSSATVASTYCTGQPSAAIRLCNADDSLVSRNVVRDSLVRYADCLSLEASSDNEIFTNRLANCTATGITGSNSDRIALVENDTSSNLNSVTTIDSNPRGLVVSDSDHWSVRGHESLNNDNGAGRFTDVAELSIEGGHFSKPLPSTSAFTIHIDRVSSLDTPCNPPGVSCQSLDCCEAGSPRCFSDGYCASVAVVGAEITGRDLFLFEALQGRYVLVGNTIQNSPNDGIFIGSSGSGLIDGNRIFNNDNVGIWLSDAVGAAFAGPTTVSNNLVMSNAFAGFQFTNLTVGNTFTGNILQNATNVLCHGSCNNSWDSNYWNNYTAPPPHPVCAPPTSCTTQDSNPQQSIFKRVRTKPAQRLLGRPYRIEIEIRNDLPETSPGEPKITVDGLRLESTDPTAAEWTDWSLAVEQSPSDLDFDASYDKELAPAESEIYEATVTTSWNWIEPRDNAFEWLEFLSGLIPLYGDWKDLQQGIAFYLDAVNQVEPLVAEYEVKPASLGQTFDLSVEASVHKKFMAGYSAGAAAFAVVNTILGFACIPLPCFFASQMFFIFESISLMAADFSYQEAEDPIADCARPIQVHDLTPPEVRALEEGPEKELALETSSLLSLAAARRDALICLYGSLAAGQDGNVRARRGEAVRFTTAARDQLLRVRHAWREMAQDKPDLSYQDVTNAQNEIAQNGLPQIEVDLLTRHMENAGFTDEAEQQAAIQRIATALTSIPPPCSENGNQPPCSPGNTVKTSLVDGLLSGLARDYSRQLMTLASVCGYDYNGDGTGDFCDADENPLLAPDTDGDGLPDMYELVWASDPTGMSETGDDDSDGVDNLTEYQDGTDPTSCDSDGDGICDPGTTCGCGSDNCPLTSNASQTDTDGDSEGDACDIDDDDDGLTDAQDILYGGDPLSVDTDGDGIGDASDNCIAHENLTQSDCDMDGVGDTCDPFESSPSCAMEIPSFDSRALSILVLLMAAMATFALRRQRV